VAVIKLVGEMLQTLQLHDGGRIATTRLTPEMFERVGAEPGDSEGLIDYPRSIAGVDAVALIRQRDDGSHKVSLRSRGDVDVEKIARHHGGGGHRNAAGFVLEGDGEAARQKVADALAAALAQPAPPAEVPEGA
jgi:phosphoesterase RecJ-like protein